ncbi:ComEA family DNA-binding protein [Microvirga aerilata]|nr:helix-hairpin-helix domain-containing protein [Microvirga aerilata]
MQIGNLSRTQEPRTPQDSALRQAMRVFFVIGLMAAGGLGLSWWSHRTGPSPQGAVAAADLQAAPAIPQPPTLVNHTARLEAVEVNPPLRGAVPAVEAASYVPADASNQPVSLPVSLPPAANAAPLKAQASLKPVASPPPADPVDTDMTGTVTPQASLADAKPLAAAETSLVDLNTASFAQLNSLKGAGALGRAIIKGRPYASVDDLMRKKVLRRTAFEKIKDQVTVR